MCPDKATAVETASERFSAPARSATEAEQYEVVTYCYHCARPTTPASIEGCDVPHCEVHGALWLLVRTGATAEVFVQQHGKVLLIRRAIEPFKSHWAAVGGFINPGESPSEAAKREAHEELGVEVNLIGLLGVYHCEYVPGDWTVASVYVASTAKTPVSETAEVSAWEWFGPDELPSQMAWNHRERAADWARYARGHLSLGQI